MQHTTNEVHNLESTIKPETYSSLEFTRGSDGYDHITQWLVDGALPANSFGMIYGHSSSCKSFQAISIACSIASDTDWCAHSVDHGIVIYVAGEGGHGIPPRIKAWEIANNEAANDVFVLGHSLFPSQDETQETLISAIKQIEEAHAKQVKLIIFDTLARCFEGDENSARDMNSFVSGCDKIRAETGTSIMCIHHSGKDSNKGARGSSVLRAACDYEFHVKRNGNSKLITFDNTKQKDGAALPSLELEMETIDLGIVDNESRPITSLTTVNAQTKETPPKVLAKDPVLEAITERFSGVTTRGELRRHLYGNTLNDSERQAYRRKLKQLSTSGNISISLLKATASDDDVINVLY